MRLIVSVGLAYYPWKWHWGRRALLVAQVVSTCCGNAVGGGALAHWGGTVATEEECVGLYNGKAHPHMDEVCHVRVCAAPLLCE